MKKKMGRPISQVPKKNIVGCKLTDIELERLELFCQANDISKSNVLRNGIKNIINDKE
jgi:hypothetical protein